MKVALIMGSDSDWPVLKAAYGLFENWEIACDAFVMSAHRTPERVAEFASSAKKDGYGVILAAAGMAAHLAGVVAAHTTLPVVGIPIRGKALDGLDALLATVQMPPGVPVATVGIDAAKNGALLAAQILGLSDAKLAEKLEEYKKEMAREVAAKDAALQKEITNHE